MRKSVVAFGTCPTCNQFVQCVGHSVEHAKTVLLHGHGRQHIFTGSVQTRPCDAQEARKIERMAA
jgi:hypothetical protein